MHFETLAGQTLQSESILGSAIGFANLTSETVCTCHALTLTDFESGLGIDQAKWADPQ